MFQANMSALELQIAKIKKARGVSGPPLRSAVGSETYMLDNGRQLQIVVRQPMVHALAKVFIERMERVMSTDARDAMLPIESVTPYVVLFDDTTSYVVKETVYRHAQKGSVQDVNAYFKTAQDMLVALFDAALKLRKRGIIPKNVSIKTVQFDLETKEFIFIDNDQVCLLSAAESCMTGITNVVTGFALPEDEPDPVLKKGLLAAQHFGCGLAAGNIDLNTPRINAPPMYDISPLKLEHALVHALLCVCLLYRMPDWHHVNCFAWTQRCEWINIMEHTCSMDVSQRLTLQQARDVAMTLPPNPMIWTSGCGMQKLHKRRKTGAQ